MLDPSEQNWHHLHIDLGQTESVQYREGKIATISWDYNESKLRVLLQDGMRFVSDFRLPEHQQICERLFCACVASQPILIGYVTEMGEQILSLGIPSQLFEKCLQS